MSRNTIQLRMGTETLLVYLAVQPVFFHIDRDQKTLINISNMLLDHVKKMDNVSEQAGIVGLVFIVARMLRLETVLRNEFLNQCTVGEKDEPLLNSFPPDEAEEVAELAREDTQYYLHWILPYLQKAGVRDIDSELQEIDAINEVIYVDDTKGKDEL